MGVGIGFGIFQGTFAGSHGELIGESSTEQIKFAMRNVVRITINLSKKYSLVTIFLYLEFWNGWIGIFICRLRTSNI